jgi:hypothetical protein
MSELLSSIVGGGGSLFIPQTSIAASTVSLKASTGAEYTSNESGFFTSGIDVSHTEQGWESVSMTATGDTTEQTVIDTTGAGVLTHVMTPTMVATGVMTIRVTIDGVEKVFTSSSISSGVRFCIGGFLTGRLASVSQYGLSVGGNGDAGFSSANLGLFMTSLQSVSEFLIGTPFFTSLKVTVQGSSAITGTVQENKAALAYLTSIPEGL